MANAGFLQKYVPNLSKFLQLKINIHFLRYLPFNFYRIYLLLLGWLYFALHTSEKQLIETAVAGLFQNRLTGRRFRAAVRKVFHGIIDHYHEKLFVAYVYFPRLIKFLKTRIVMAGEPILRQALEAGKGVILVTGHYGGVELLPGFLAVAGFPVTMICRFQTSRLRQSMEQRAGWVGLSLIDADSPNIFFKAVQALKQGHILITECDEFEAWRPDSQGRLNFLQAELPQDRTLELFQRRAGAPVVCALLRREGGRRYTLQFASVALQPGQGRRPLSQQCLEVLEEAILSQPAQWYQWKKFAQFCYANGVSHPGIS